LYQVTGHTYEYIIEIFKHNVEAMSREQIILLLYHEMRHINIEGKLVEHEINDWVCMIDKLGPNWATTKASVPDLLDEDINWENIQGPPTLFPEERLRVVK